MATTKRIRVSIETHQALLALGRKGESYDNVIRRLIIHVQECSGLEGTWFADKKIEDIEEVRD